MSDATNDQQPSVPGESEGMPGWAGAGGALAPDADTVEAASTQDEPALDQNDASDEDRIAGIAAQTRSDVGDQDADRVAEVLRQRFADAGLDVDGSRTAALAAEITNG
jgi:hypothetical protein